MFSKACQYGLKASIFIVEQSARNIRVSLKEIAKNINSPEAFTAKILHNLARRDIITSRKGPKGGFEISMEKARNTTLKDIVYAIDGDSVYQGCVLGFESCDENAPCAAHHKLAGIREQLKRKLNNTTLYEMAEQVSEGAAVLKR